MLLLKRCPEHLSEHPGGKKGSDLLATGIRWSFEYNECAATHNSLIDALEEPKR